MLCSYTKIKPATKGGFYASASQQEQGGSLAAAGFTAHNPLAVELWWRRHPAFAAVFFLGRCVDDRCEAGRAADGDVHVQQGDHARPT